MTGNPASPQASLPVRSRAPGYAPTRRPRRGPATVHCRHARRSIGACTAADNRQAIAQRASPGARGGRPLDEAGAEQRAERRGFRGLRRRGVDDLGLPDLSFAFYDRMVVFDKVNKTLDVVVFGATGFTGSRVFKKLAEIAQSGLR